ncbi:MAG: lysylphosphatidylglycerol synthase transmembrane domain-containing protein [Alphaproteobacteria bacterium]
MKHKSLLAKLTVSIALLALLAFEIDGDQIKSLTNNIHPVSWAYALFFLFIQIAALAIRWEILVNTANPKPITYATSLRIISISQLANYIFITSLGGIISRIGLTMSCEVPFVKSLAATIIDRGMTLVALVLLALACAPFLWELFPNEMTRIAIILGGVSIVGLFVLSLLYKKRRAIIFYDRRITVCFKYLRTLLTDPIRLGRVIGISLAGQLMYFAAVYVLIHSLGAEFSFFQFMAVIPGIALIAALPIGYAGWGIREGAFVYGLSLIGMSSSAAFTASIQIGLISMLISAILGIPAFMSSHTQTALKTWRLKKKFKAVDVLS